MSMMKGRLFPRLIVLVGALLLLGQIQVSGQDDSPPRAPAAPVNCSSTTCPASYYASLDKCVERTDFCVYYTTAGTTETEADWAADQVQAYWNRFTSLSFNAPKHSGKFEVYLRDLADCNGGTDWSTNRITTYTGCWTLGDDIAQKVLGHELTHRVQYSYDTSAGAPIQTKFLKEGTARASEDNWFLNIDHLPVGTGGSTYCNEAGGYLANPNVNLSTLWYPSCVWWKWASEQYVPLQPNPDQGVDFFRQVYLQNTAGYSGIAAVNRALTALSAGVDFEESFTKFAVAAYTKDLTGLPDDSYNIVDEDEPGSPGACSAVTVADLGPISGATSRQWLNQNVEQYGARYYAADIGASCPVISASFHQDGGQAFYHVVTQDGNTFKTHVQGSGTDWTQSFVNDGVTQVTAVAGALDPLTQVDVTLSCADPDLDIKLPNAGAPMHVQGNTKFLAQVLVTNGSPAGPVVAGLTNSDFAARVGGADATVTGGGFVQEQYWLVIRAPSGLADGTYDLEVMLEEPGTSTVVATDTEPNSIVYTSDKVDHVLVIDRSGSMGTPIEPTDAKLQAAKDAASFYVDVTRDNDGLAVVAYNHDVNPAPFPMQTVNAGVRTGAKNYINDWSVPNGIYASGSTSIGDGLAEAVNQRADGGNPLCSFVLLSDGMENTPKYWADVRGDVQDTGCPVTTVAFGPASNETLMQTIATDTGGPSFYNDVYVSALLQEANALSIAQMNLELGDTYEYSQGASERRQRLLAEMGVVGIGQVKTHEVVVDDSIVEAVFALDWYEQYGAALDLVLISPSGKKWERSTEPYTFPDVYDPWKEYSTHVGWRIPDPEPGTWKLEVHVFGSEDKAIPYQVLVSGQTGLTLHLVLPGMLGTQFTTGNRVPIVAMLSAQGPVSGAVVSATITAPDCGWNSRQTALRLFDDGEHGDGNADDGVYANLYRRLNCALAVPPPLEGDVKPGEPQDEGGYAVVVRARSPKFQREAKGAFAVLEGVDDNQNRVPDVWEKENGVTDLQGDPDLDGLSNLGEYQAGTDPHDSDTDDGGENDGSEVNWGHDPLDPADDGIKAPDFLHVIPLDGKVRLLYDVKQAYALMELWRATSPDGDWTLRAVQQPPLTGEYEDGAANDTTYFYRLIAEDSAVVKAPGHRSAAIQSEPVTPSIDPVPPQAWIVVDGGAASTRDRGVILSFVPYEYEEGDPDGFSDIVAFMASNDPSFGGASWQSIAGKPEDERVPWVLGGGPDSLNLVYVRFRDSHGNESAGTEVGSIFYDPYAGYLPVITRSQ